MEFQVRPTFVSVGDHERSHETQKLFSLAHAQICGDNRQRSLWTPLQSSTLVSSPVFSLSFFVHPKTHSPMKTHVLLLIAACALSFSLIPQVTAASVMGECLPVGDDKNTFHCLKNKKAVIPCEDLNDNCQAWARKGECSKNPGFMMNNCRSSCGTCLDIHVGETQVSPDAATRRDVLERLVATQDYIYQETAKNPRVFRKCKNGAFLCVGDLGM